LRSLLYAAILSLSLLLKNELTRKTWYVIRRSSARPPPCVPTVRHFFLSHFTPPLHLPHVDPFFTRCVEPRTHGAAGVLPNANTRRPLEQLPSARAISQPPLSLSGSPPPPPLRPSAARPVFRRSHRTYASPLPRPPPIPRVPSPPPRPSPNRASALTSAPSQSLAAQTLTVVVALLPHAAVACPLLPGHLSSRLLSNHGATTSTIN
jgi:hypothetical protein